MVKRGGATAGKDTRSPAADKYQIINPKISQPSHGLRFMKNWKSNDWRAGRIFEGV
jgi:hypothetical protein